MHQQEFWCIHSHPKARMQYYIKGHQTRSKEYDSYFKSPALEFQDEKSLSIRH